MSSKLDINQDSINLNINIKITIYIFIITVLGVMVTTPARATSLKNTLSEEQIKSLYNPHKAAIPSDELLGIPLTSQAVLSKNSEEKNELQYRLFQETQNTLNQVKQASQVTQETVGDKKIYLYNLDTKPVNASSTNTNIPVVSRSPWKLPASAPRRKVPEPATSVGLLAILVFFAKRRKLK